MKNEIRVKYNSKKINKDLISTIVNQLWRVVSGPLTLLFIPMFLSAETQGFWYSFSSLSALSIFADLGFSNIVLQFSAHEFSKLKYKDDGSVSGEKEHLKSLAAFFKFTRNWTVIMIVLVFPIIMFVGINMFNKQESNIVWLIPWIIFLIGSAINFFSSTLLCFIEGCDKVAIVQNIRFKVAVINSIIIIIGLATKMNLFALAIASIVSSIMMLYLITKKFSVFTRQLLLLAKGLKYKDKKKFFNLLWRYAISFASGYFILQIYTPIMLNYKGAVEAGKVGISMTLWNTAFNVSNVFIIAITPKINMLVSQKKYNELDFLFKKNFILSIGTYLIGMIIGLIAFVMLRGKLAILDRFLPNIAMIMLAVSWLLAGIVNTLAVYLRAHKEEPLVNISVFNGIFTLLITVICAKYLSVDYYFLGLLISYMISTPYAIWVFLRKRKEWHYEMV